MTHNLVTVGLSLEDITQILVHHTANINESEPTKGELTAIMRRLGSIKQGFSPITLEQIRLMFELLRAEQI